MGWANSIELGGVFATAKATDLIARNEPEEQGRKKKALTLPVHRPQSFPKPDKTKMPVARCFIQIISANPFIPHDLVR